MAENQDILRLDGEDYVLAELTQEARQLVYRLHSMDKVVDEKRSMLAVLAKAKNAYISDLKNEIIKTSSGVDLSSLFDED